MTMKRWLSGLLAIPALIWLISLPTGYFENMTFWNIRKDSIYLTGILAYVMMAWTMVLAMRTSWLENRVSGLDRAYRLHKWSGITLTILVFFHWMLEIVPKSLSKAGWIARPLKKASDGAEPFFYMWRDVAKDLGEWIGYVGLALIVLALLKMVPHRWFRLLHKTFPVIFLLTTLHSVVLLPDAFWPTPLGIMVASCALAGSIASLYSLAGLIGRTKQTQGEVIQVERLGQVLMVACQLQGSGLNYQAGQFVYLRFANSDSAHPFTIASYDDSKILRFYIKALGDDTRNWLQQLQVGSSVRIEGPYGRFNFSQSTTAPQLWVAGGIGITPFLARMEYLIAQGKPSDNPQPQLIYCAEASDPLLPRVRHLCEAAGVKLHLVSQSTDGNLSLERALAVLEQPQDAKLWFCGPRGLGDALENEWQKLRRPRAGFHREFFAMR